MASVKLGDIFPFGYPGGYGGFAYQGMTFDASTDAMEFVFQAPEDDTITGAMIRQQTETGDDTTVFRVSMQSVDGSGNPDGTILGATSNGYGDYTATTAKDNSIQRVAFGEGVSVTKGTWYSLVVKYQSGTVLPTNTVSFTGGISHNTGSGRAPLPGYWINNNAGSRTRNSSHYPCFGIYSSTSVYGYPVETTTTVAYRANTAGADEYGVQFSIPSGWCSTYKLAGIWVYANFVAGTTHDVTLWSNASPPVNLATLSYDGDYEPTNDVYFHRLLFTGTLPTLTAGTTYNITIFNNSTATNMTLAYIDVDQAGDFAAFPWGDITMYEAKRLDAASSFTTTNTRRPVIGLVLQDITPPTGGSGGGYVIGNHGYTGVGVF